MPAVHGGTYSTVSSQCANVREDFSAASSHRFPQSRWHPGAVTARAVAGRGTREGRLECSGCPLTQALLICKARRMGYRQETLGPQKHESTSTPIPTSALRAASSCPGCGRKAPGSEGPLLGLRPCPLSNFILHWILQMM